MNASNVLAGVIGTILAYFAVTASDRRSPVQVDGYDVITKEVARGGEFAAVWRETLFRDCDGVARRWLQSVSDKRWYLPLASIDIELGSMVERFPSYVEYPVTPFWLPDDAPLGEMTYHNETKLVCHPFGISWLPSGTILAPIVVRFPAITFTVVERSPDREYRP